MAKTFIVAEMSANHNGSKEIALETIRAAKRAGADAVKLQTYTADTITLDCNKDDFQIKQGTIWDGQTLYQLYKKAYTPWEWHEELFEEAKKQGLICFSTPFDYTAVDLLESLGNPIYKIASFEITDVNLIKYCARKMKPMVISTGIATEEDLELAIATCRKVGNDDITLLKCTSAYPSPVEKSQLCMIQDMAIKYNVKTGLSDHTIGSFAPILSVALGGVMIEKHFIIDRSIGGEDCSFSMDEKEFAQMVKDVRLAEQAIGEVSYELDPLVLPEREFSRSLYIAEDMKAGDILNEKNLRSVRPGFGLHPKYLDECLGKKVNRDLEKGTRMSLEIIQK
ncbi:pseudaminic acid synthase [Mediterranea massiliensis]|uniref:Pseudaminic acid synthase n=1 Tax=Mediterranea massiliensis TaxID=1841865 RepID=A0ABS2E410_9BACT|nr:pseudaminic acid synthase [Mediterranea massiliensis]MBM6736360.1 pseudaminic acid synthase [Mediterranea massiliensis]